MLFAACAPFAHRARLLCRQANAKQPYLDAIRSTLDAALCLQNFPSQEVERHNMPEIFFKCVAGAVRRPAQRHRDGETYPHSLARGRACLRSVETRVVLVGSLSVVAEPRIYLLVVGHCCARDAGLTRSSSSTRSRSAAMSVSGVLSSPASTRCGSASRSSRWTSSTSC